MAFDMREKATITIWTTSPGLRPDGFDVVVTAPTFRRPDHLLKTLESLRLQRTKRRFAVIVMENEAEHREGAIAARSLFESGDLPGLIVIAHERGNCSAYNAGWETALNQFPGFKHLLVIDDDEVADPDWIERMCVASETLGADIVGGPQMPVFAEPTGNGWAGHPVFALPYAQTGRVPALYSSGNLLISRSVLERMGPPFLDLRFNFTGGGDSDFLSRSAQAGFVLGWCAEAPIHETVPERRTQRDWIHARSLRNGALSTQVEKKRRAGQPLGNVIAFAHSVALLAASPIRSAIQLLRGVRPRFATYPMLIGLGRVMAHFGYANEQYRQPEKN